MTHTGGPQDWNPTPQPAAQYPPPGQAQHAPPGQPQYAAPAPAPHPAAPPAPYAPAPYGAPPAPYGAPPAYAPPGGGYGYAGGPSGHLPQSSGGRRFGAYLLDALLIVVTLYIGWIIWTLVTWGKGQSPGKQLMHMRCIDVNTGRAATWGTMAMREIVGKSLLASVTCGITTLVSLFMILGAERRGVWDKMANTIVIDDPQDAFAP